ncbi:MAG: hypothetical protein H0T46_17425 [Deltaproteobacteria bacterium]|nr:hypothetical protein [Deltaproteobacteria bacterium]
MTKLHLIVIVAGLTMAGCPKKSGGTSTPTGGGGDTAAKPLANNMADAPKHAVGSTLDLKPACNQDEYMVLDVAEGTPFTIDAKPSEGCMHVTVMKDNGSSNDMPNLEVCADAVKPPMEAVGQATRTLVSFREVGACKGISATVSFK